MTTRLTSAPDRVAPRTEGDVSGQRTGATPWAKTRYHRWYQEVAREAVRDYIERTSRQELLDRVLDEELPRYAEALERLGE
jgi:hypothetical protein